MHVTIWFDSLVLNGNIYIDINIQASESVIVHEIAENI